MTDGLNIYETLHLHCVADVYLCLVLLKTHLQQRK